MAQYQETKFTGVTFKRPTQVDIRLPTPDFKGLVLVFQENTMIYNADTGQEVRVGDREIKVIIDDATAVEKVPIRDLSTGEVTGEVLDYGLLTQLLGSIYWAKAQELDGL